MGSAEKSIIEERLRSLTAEQRRFRVNAGLAWTGIVKHLPGGDILIHNPRPFHGAPKGSPDLWGFDSVVITPDMVGRRVALAVYEEAKTPGGRLSCEQKLFRDMAERLGAVFRIIE